MSDLLRQKKRSPLVLLLLILLWSIGIGVGLAQAQNNFPPSPQLPHPSQIAETGNYLEGIPFQASLGEETYLENCAQCHIAIPPSVLPTETWRRLLLDPQHYGTQIKLLVDPPLQLVWAYLRNYSRSQGKDEELAYRIAQSRFFKALHPEVQLPKPLTLSTCVSCHPKVRLYNFRVLTPEWENPPNGS